MWTSQIKRKIIQRMQDVSVRATGIYRESADGMFHRFLEVIACPDDNRRNQMEERFLSELNNLEKNVPMETSEFTTALQRE